MHYKRWRKTGHPLTGEPRDVRPAIPHEDYYLIPLGTDAKDGYTKVSVSHKNLDRYKWYKGQNGYAITKIKAELIYMHRLVANTPPKLITDHINGDKLDNRKENLRACDYSVNALNYHRLRKLSYLQ